MEERMEERPEKRPKERPEERRVGDMGGGGRGGCVLDLCALHP